MQFRNPCNRVPLARGAFVVLLACFLFVSCASEEQGVWEAARAEGSVEAYEAFLGQFPESEFAPQAEALIIDLLPLIPFTSERDETFAIYTMKVDGSEETRVSPNDHKSSDPALSPDTTRIAFASDHDGGGRSGVLGSHLLRGRE